VIRSIPGYSVHMITSVLMTGASGLVGKAIRSALEEQNIQVRPLSHRDPAWDWSAGTLDAQVLEGIDAVIHLAGEPIANKRWSARQKEKIRNSRVIGTRAIADAMAGQSTGPRTLIMASAIGIYGDRGDDELTESAPSADGFLAAVVQNWESAAVPAETAGIRVVQLRLGIVLSEAGGALAKMLLPFRMGLGGPLGSGKAWMSWIHLDDVTQAFLQALQNPDWQGAYNLTSPNPVTNKVFSQTLASTLSRPCLFPVPPPVLRFLFGEMADEALLASAKVLPDRLLQAGFTFKHPEIRPALFDLLKD